MIQKMLMIEPSKCTGCRTCEMACSLYNEQQCSPVLSRIRVVRFEAKGISFPGVCLHCSKPKCMEACPTDAIARDKTTGMVLINEAECIGCSNCIQACPFGQISFHPEKQIAFKCHLCGGEPTCAAFCDSGAIQYISTEEYLMAKRRRLIQKQSRAKG